MRGVHREKAAHIGKRLFCLLKINAVPKKIRRFFLLVPLEFHNASLANMEEYQYLFPYHFAFQKQKRALAADILGEENFARTLTLDDSRFLSMSERHDIPDAG